MELCSRGIDMESTQNFTFLVYGLMAAWLILFGYVAAIASRERRIRAEIEGLKRMLEEHGPRSTGKA